ncbi:hypothetical protein MPSEU_000620100 [Mayamaea pseudoterrestris]|nr:hypothetical protein MPSEU_000620100 [Mayamaea pseudoterrestris]
MSRQVKKLLSINFIAGSMARSLLPEKSKHQYSSDRLRSIRLVAVCITGCFVLSSIGLYICIDSLDDSNTSFDPSVNGIFLLNSMRRAARERRLPSTPRLKKRQANAIKAAKQDTHASQSTGSQSKQTKRQLFEKEFPPDDMNRIERVVASLRTDDPQVPRVDFDYDIDNCPATPPSTYPHHWNLLNILQAWDPNNTTIPSIIYNSLCVFDFRTDEAIVQTYRQREVPFVVRHYPDLYRATERWNYQDYLLNLVGPNVPQRNEHSRNNRFMFWRKIRGMPAPADWKPPTDMVQMTLKEWMRKANELEQQTKGRESAAANVVSQTEQDHWYFRLNGAYKNLNDYLYDELPFFRPDQPPSLFMVDPSEERGINCRFGMTGVTAESHFDPTRNWIVLLGGHRRYILSHPRECINLELYPLGHPSGRHSALDWSKVSSSYSGPLSQAAAHEVVLQPGDALYLPTSYFHFIVSLDTTYQCNARSGVTTENIHHLHECGFPV